MANKLNHKYFKSLFDLFSEPLIVVKKDDLNILYCNSEFENIMEKSSKYILGNSLDKIFIHDLFFLSNIKDLLYEGYNFIIKDRVKINNIQYEVKCINCENFDDRITLFFCEIQIKERFHFEDNSSKILNDTLAILGHELSNPITTIKIATDLIKKKKIDDDNELLNIIKKEADRIINIFDNFKVSNSENNIKKKENIHEIIRFSLIKFIDVKKRIKIEEIFDPSLPHINVNRDTLIQVFDNILRNSVDASLLNNDSFIRIFTKFKGGETIKIPNIVRKIKKKFINIRIIDNGGGIEPDKHNQIFLPFFTTKKKGSGIGLFLVKKIINDHDGDISIKSSNGLTEVNINLPI